MLPVLFCIGLFISSVFGVPVTYTDWQQAKDELIAKKALWDSQSVSSYAYSIRDICFCFGCILADKIVAIDNDLPVFVEVDDNTAGVFGCNPADFASPPLVGVNNIDYYYDQAIAHAQAGIDANCPDPPCDPFVDPICTFPPAICGGSITFDFDPILFYPTLLSLNFGPFIADAGRTWVIDCLNIYGVAPCLVPPCPTLTGLFEAQGYNNTCSQYPTPPIPGIDLVHSLYFPSFSVWFTWFGAVNIGNQDNNEILN